MRKKIMLLTGIIVISSFSIGYITSILVNINTPNYDPDVPNDDYDIPKFYIAIDDTYYSGVDNREIINGNKAFLVAGRYNNVSWSSFYYTFIKFDLRDKPERWDGLEVSFYVYEYERNYWDANIMLLLNDWNEQMNSEDIHYNLPTHSGADFYWEHSLGLQKINITNYIGDNESITIRIGAHGTYSTGGSLRFVNNYIMIYSKEANVSKSYLPQLIYS